jgi:hypothetical protein
LVGEKKETSGMRRVVRAAAKYRLKFLYTAHGVVHHDTIYESDKEVNKGMELTAYRLH